MFCNYVQICPMTINLYHFRSRSFWTIELLHHLLWSKAIQFHLSWNIWMEKDASKSTPKRTTAYKHWYLKHLQFCAFIHRLLSLLGAKHFERRKCGHPDVLREFWKEASLVTYPKKRHQSLRSHVFQKCGKKKLWKGLPTMFTWTLQAQVDGVSQRNPGRVPGHVISVKQLPRCFCKLLYLSWTPYKVKER